MANIIKIKRGLSKDLSKANLQEGEIAFTTDTKKLYVSNTDEPINNDTTYSLSKSGSTITLTGSDGSTTSVSDSNTTYNEATSSANGLMSSTDKKRLDAITAAYDMGSMAGKTKAQLQAYLDTWLTTYGNIPGAVAYFTAAGDWVTVWNSTDTTLTISAGGRYVVSVIGTYGSKDYVQLRLSTYHDEYVFYIAKSGGVWRDAHQVAYKDDLPSNVTTSVAGLMSAADKTKLDGIAEGANNYTYTLPTASSTLGGVKTTSTVTSTSGLTACPIIGGVPYYKDTNTTYTLPNATSSTLGGVKIGSNITISSGTISLTKDNVTAALGYTPPTTNTTYSVATTSANGLMSSTDKSKLDGIATGATKNTASSTTPKANGTAAVGSESNYARGDHVHPAQTTVSGNAGTATKFASAQSVTLTGDITGSASSQAGWSVATTLANSGVTAGSYGPTANVTGTDGTTINVPQITVDAKGRVTSVVNRVYTSKNTDTNTTYSNMTAATSSAAGKAGLVPAPAAGKQASFLRGDGTWVVPTNTTYSAATTSAAGLMSATDKSKLDGIASGANAYSLPTASSSILGGIKVGTNLSISNGVLSATNTTYSAATTSANGLMSSSDKTKLNGIATGAQVNNVVVSTSKPSSGDVWINPNGTSALDAVSVIGEYARLVTGSHQTVTQSAAWGDIILPFGNGTFTTSNSSMFSVSGNGIKCNFTGRVIVMPNIGTGQTGKELDIEVNNSNGSPSMCSVINISQGTVCPTYVFDVNSGAVLTVGINSNSTSFTFYSNSSFYIIRIK